MRPSLTALVVGCVLALPQAPGVAVHAPPAAASSSAAGEPAPSPGSPTAAGMDLTPLQALVDEARADHVRLSIGVRSLDGATLTDGTVVVGSTDPYRSASLVKLALVTTVLRSVDRGELSLDQVETVTSRDDVGGSGVLAGYPQPYDATVAELAGLAITVSDNTASNVLAELVGLDAVDSLVTDLGIAPTHMGRLFFSSGPPGESNDLDTASTVELMRAVYEGEVLSPASRDRLLGWMRDQQLDTKFAPALPGVPLASKTGDTSTISHDGAYLLEPGRETVLVVLSETLDGSVPTTAADPYLAEAARLVHDQVVAAPLAPVPVTAPLPTPTASADVALDAGGGARAGDDADAGTVTGAPAPPLAVVVVAGVVLLALAVVAVRGRWWRRGRWWGRVPWRRREVPR